jgi:tRNA(fMet)-specific endonuclease VapC
MKYALDTNIVSFGLKNLYNLESKIDTLLDAGHILVIPPITFYEIMRGLLAVNAQKKLNRFNFLCGQLGLSKMNDADWMQAASLYAWCKQTGHPMGETDLLQAAFCLQQKCILVTNNTQHFVHITNLMIEDWVTK